MHKNFTITKTRQLLTCTIVTIVTDAGQADLLTVGTGSASLLAVAHALYKEHYQKIEIDAIEYKESFPGHFDS